MNIQDCADARLAGNDLVSELADRGMLTDPVLREVSRALLEKLGFEPEWVAALVD